jgi:hypothetical protein
VLANDEAVEFGNDFAGGEGGHGKRWLLGQRDMCAFGAGISMCGWEGAAQARTGGR